MKPSKRKKEILEILKNEIDWCLKHNKKPRDISGEIRIYEKGFVDGLRQSVRIIKKELKDSKMN
jgi:hypothetical protein